MSNIKRNEYVALLLNFIQEHIDDFNNSKQYTRQWGSSTSLSYIPEQKDRDEPSYIANKAYYHDFVNRIFDAILYASDLVFETLGHISDLDGKTLQSFSENENSQFSKNSLISKLSTKIAIDLYRAYESLKKNEVFDETRSCFFIFDNCIEIMSSRKCTKCDDHLNLYINLDKGKICFELDNAKPCSLPKKPNNIKITLKAPSKKLVFLNSPSKFINIEREDKYEVSINSTLGCIKETKMYETYNIGFFFVGNTYLHAMKKENTILFANFDDSSAKDIKKFKDYEEKGSVCMDLWWYTVLDFDLYVELCAKNNVKPKDTDHIVVDIEGTTVKINHSLKAHSSYFNGTHSKITVTE